MPHISIPEGIPGIVGPLTLFPDTGAPLRALTEALLRGPSPLSAGEREVIAAYVSNANQCGFCTRSHAAAARHLPGDVDPSLVDAVLADLDTAPVDDKLKALLRIAGKVQRSGREVLPEDVEQARRAGADDRAIHDTVLIAAAFCMFNRYVDGLATWTPEDGATYDGMGAGLAARGYLEGASGPQDEGRNAVVTASGAA